MSKDLRASITDLVDKLVKAREEQRKADDEVRRLKVELNAHSVKLAVQEGSVSIDELATMAHRVLRSW